MFPLRDVNRAERPALVTWTLIAINFAVFVGLWLLGPPAQALVSATFGLVPMALLTTPTVHVWLTPLTSMFLHGGWFHVLPNLWFLHVFGDNVEDHLGRGRYLALYLLSGFAAAVLHVALSPFSTIPLVGASGAIAGVLGAYMFRFPRAPILAWFGIAIVELPAFAFLFVWFGYQLVMTLGSHATEARGGIAFAAHVGGFVAGVLIDRLFEAQPSGPTRPR